MKYLIFKAPFTEVAVFRNESLMPVKLRVTACQNSGLQLRHLVVVLL